MRNGYEITVQEVDEQNGETKTTSVAWGESDGDRIILLEEAASASYLTSALSAAILTYVTAF